MPEIVDEFNECEDCGHRHDQLHECPNCGSSNYRQVVKYADGTFG